MKCIIIEDEPSAIEVLVDHASKIPGIEIVEKFRDPVIALEFLRENKIDFLLLDINLPKISGMHFLKILDINIPTIFTTAYMEYAVESYEKSAVDYLLKPISFDRFLMAINKVNKLLHINSESNNAIIKGIKSNKEELIYLKSGTKTYRIDLNKILFIEKDGHYATIVTDYDKVVMRMSMKEVHDLFESEDFIQIHRSFVVSIPQIDIIEKHQITLGKHILPVGKMYRRKLEISLHRNKT